MNQSRSKISHDRWSLAESVVVLPYQTVNAKGVEIKGREAGNGPWQQMSHVAKERNGDLLVMTPLADPPQTALIRSSDQGKTWSEPQYVWENRSADEYSAGCSCMTVLRSGRILAMIHGEYPGWPKDLRTPTWPLYSDDDAKAWQQGPMVTDTAPFLCTVPSAQMVEDSDGTVILPVFGCVRIDAESPLGGAWATGLIRSRDGGRTWGDASIVMPGDPALGTYPNEIAVLPLASGMWLSMFRMNWAKPSEWYSVMLLRALSHDRGRTWSPPELVLGQTGFICLQQLPDGAVMASGSGAFATRYLISYDEGLTWAYEQLLDPCGDSNTTSVVLDDKTVFMVHSSALGPPHYHLRTGLPHECYWYEGLRGRWIRKEG